MGTEHVSCQMVFGALYKYYSFFGNFQVWNLTNCYRSVVTLNTSFQLFHQLSYPITFKRSTTRETKIEWMKRGFKNSMLKHFHKVLFFFVLLLLSVTTQCVMAWGFSRLNFTFIHKEQQISACKTIPIKHY